MGMDFTPSWNKLSDKSKAVTYAVHDWNDDEIFVTITNKVVVGNHVFSIEKAVCKKTGQTKYHMLFVTLLEFSRKTGWGHKKMAETEGPLAYDCPLDLLEESPNPIFEKTDMNIKLSMDFRNRVVNYHSMSTIMIEEIRMVSIENSHILNEDKKTVCFMKLRDGRTIPYAIFEKFANKKRTKFIAVYDKKRYTLEVIDLIGYKFVENEALDDFVSLIMSSLKKIGQTWHSQEDMGD